MDRYQINESSRCGIQLRRAKMKSQLYVSENELVHFILSSKRVSERSNHEIHCSAFSAV